MQQVMQPVMQQHSPRIADERGGAGFFVFLVFLAIAVSAFLSLAYVASDDGVDARQTDMSNVETGPGSLPADSD